MKKLFTLLLSIAPFCFTFAQPVGGTVSPATTTVCSGTNSGILTLSGHTGTIVRWQSSTNGGASWTNIANTTTTQSYSNLTITTWYRVEISMGGFPNTYSSTAQVNVDAASSGTVSSNATVCTGANSGTLSLTGTFTSVAQWDSSTNGGATWFPIANTTTLQAYSNLTVTTLYRANVINGTCPAANSTTATITVNPATVGGTVSGSASECSGSNSGTLTLIGHTGSVVRWESSTNGGVSWTNITNTNTFNNYLNITQTTMYRAVVQSGVCAAENSSSATITVDPASVGGTVSGAASVCTGANSGTLVLTGYTGNVIRWEQSIDGGASWTTIVNTTDNHTYNNLTQTTLFRAVVQSGGCASANSSSVTITVTPSTVGGSISGSTSACAGSNSGTLTLSGHTGSVVRWESSTNGGVSWTNITNTTTVYNYSNISQTTDYRAVVQSGTCASQNSASATITISPISVGGTVSSNATVCSGVNNGTLLLTGYTGNVIRWEFSTDNGVTWNAIANTTDNHTYNNLTVSTKFRAVVQSGSCASANSSVATINISPASVGGSVAGSANACSGSNSGSLTLSGHTGSVIRWESSTDGGVTWTNITNTTTFYNYSNITQTTDYRAIVQSGSCPTANSSVATVTIFPISVGGTVNSSATVCSGVNNGTLLLTGYTGTVTNWEYSTDNGATWNTIANTTDTLSYSNLTVKTLYRATVQSGFCSAKKSTTATINVNSASAGGATAGTATYCSGTNSGTITLSGHVGSILRWQSSTDGGVTWVNITNTAAFYNYSNLTQTTDFRAVVQNGNCPADNSTITTITIFPISVGGTLNSNATVCSGSNNGTLLLTGYTGNVVQWEYSTDNGSTWNVIANTTDTLSYTNLTVKTLYRTLVQSGACASKYSTTVTINVNAPSVGGIVSSDDTVCSGNNGATLILSGYVGSIVRWQSSIDFGVTWVNIVNTSAIYNYSNITQTTLFRAVVQNGSCQPMNSAYAEITVFPISVGGTLNSSATVCSGLNNGTLLLTGYTGSVVNWEYSTDNGLTWNVVPNTTDTLSYNNLTVKTLYRVKVQSGFCAPKYSTIATITVNAQSVGGTVSGTDTVCSGSNSGNLTLSGYVGAIVRWQSSTDGGVTWTNIANTTAIYNYVNINTTTNYRAVVQNGGCAADNSSQAIITVYPLSVGGTVSPASFAACSGLNSGTIVLSGQSGSIVQWESSIDGGVTWIPIANTTNTQNFQNLTQTTMYRAIVQNGQCAAAYSSTSIISVFPATVGGSVSGSDTVCTGSNSGSMVLSGFTGSILNWEFSIDGGVTWTTIANTTAIQNYTNLTITTMYRAVVQSGSCSTANSTAATITVNPATVGGTVLSSTFVCDSMTTGTLTLSGYTGTILNWEYSNDGGNTWTTIANTTSILVYSGITTQTMYRANVQSGACSAAVSQPATISLAVPAVASYSVVINGATATFTNTSTSNNGTSFWDFGDGTNSSITSPAHTYTANGTYLVTLIVTDSCGADTVIQTVIITGVGINELSYNNPDVTVYPNPFTTIATIAIAGQLQSTEKLDLKIVDMFGKEVNAGIIRTATGFVVQRNNLAAGIYFYQLFSPSSAGAGRGKVIATGKLATE